jgi:hypothetical protein
MSIHGRARKLFAVVAAEWLADKEHDVEPRTHSDYASTVRTWLTGDEDPTGHRPPFSGRVGRITAGQVEDWLRRIARCRSHRTMAKTYGVFAQIIAFATKARLHRPEPVPELPDAAPTKG